MENLLSSLTDKATEAIVKKQYEDSLPEFEDESDKIKDLEAKKEYKEAFDKAKEDMKKRGEDMLNDANEAVGAYIRQLKSDFNDLGTSLGHLSIGTAMFAARIAMVPPAIISATPMGPGVSAQLVPPLLQQLKAEGDNLSKVYDDCNSKINKLGLRALASMVPIAGSVLSVADTIFGVAVPLITMVGSSVAGAAGSIPDIKPPISISYNPKDCTNFSYIVPPSSPELEGDISASNCSRFTPMTDQDTKVSCDNCKYFNKR